MGVAVGDYNARRPARSAQDAFRRRHVPALYRNLGKGLFEDVATAAGLAVENRYVQWGAGLPDLDNDGRADLFYVTGSVYPEIERVLPGYPRQEPAAGVPQSGRRPVRERHRVAAATRRSRIPAAARPSATSTTTATSTCWS